MTVQGNVMYLQLGREGWGGGGGRRTIIVKLFGYSVNLIKGNFSIEIFSDQYTSSLSFQE